ncbi:MAG: response regulator transcription factor [Planctomycetota bacterium]
MDKGKIVVVEDEADIREILEYALGKEGFRVAAAKDGREGLALVQKELPDLVLLDLMMPGMDGLEVCRELKSRDETEEIAVVMLTAKGEESDIVLGLGLGADDYVLKPFSPKELIARVKAVLRRAGRGSSSEDTAAGMVRGALRIDPARHRVTLGESEVPLTATEFKILAMLARHPGRVFTRAQILAEARGDNAMAFERSIDAHVRSIRKKLKEERDLVETVHSIGYRFREDD